MGLKTFFQKLFKVDPKEQSSDQGVTAELLSGSPTEYSSYDGDLYVNTLVRAIVDKIASYGSMIAFEHVRGSGETFEKLTNSPLNRLLTVKPNEFMSPADLQYKTWTDLLLTNNSYQWIQWDRDGRPKRLLPVIAQHVELKEIDGFLFYKFYFPSGDKILIPMEDVIHNRRYYYKNDIFGSSNDPLRNSVGLNDTMDVSLDASLKNSAQIKGILKHQNTIDPEDLERQEKLFRESYLSAKNSGGIGMIDAKFDFIPINYSGKVLDAEQMKEIRNYTYRYFGINDNIMLSTYTSDQWQAYHEAVIAPILNRMEQNYNMKLFTERELGTGNRVVSSVNMITFMSPQQRIQMVKLSLDGALYTRNEVRAWFGDAPIKGGDTFQYSKNFTEDTSPNGGNNTSTDINSEGGENVTGGNGQTDQTDTSNAVSA